MVKAGCYAVARGRKPGVYMEWSDCEAQVLNFKGAKYKKFFNAADAELWVHQNLIGPYSSPQRAARPNVDELPPLMKSVPEACITSPSPIPTPRAAPSDDEVEEAPSSHRSSNRATSSPPLQHPIDSLSDASPPTSMTMDAMIVYTDGSCRGNGKEGSNAGVGVWWGESDPRNISERCPGGQTNNRAELIAIIRVLETTPTDRSLTVKTDSEYSINCMTRWLWGWKTKGWKKPDNAPVKNVLLIRYLDILLNERRRVFKQSVELDKVAGHSNIRGNEEADRLANEGAMLPSLPDRDWETLIQEVQARIDAASSSRTPSTAENVPQTVPSPAKTKTSSVPKQPIAPTSCAPIKPLPPPASRTYGPSTISNISCASQSVLRQSSASQAASSASRAASSASRATSSASQPASTASTSASGRTPRMPLSLSDVTVHGSVDTKISQRELEAYAACLLNDDDFLREAQEAGLC